MTYFNSQEPIVAAAAKNGTETDQGENINTDRDAREQAKELLAMHEAGIGINYPQTKELALECVDDILEHWLPEGEQRGAQYVALNPVRDDNELGSFTIHTASGRWADFAGDDHERGSDLISLIAYLDGDESQAAAAVKILKFIGGLEVDPGVRQARQVAKQKAAVEETFTPVMPIPDDAARRPIFFGAELGTPSKTWAYRNEVRQVMFYVNRFELAKGKTTRPLIYCSDSSGATKWKLKAPPAPRIPYGLDRLAARPEAGVLFTEGEKTADAAQRLFPELVAVTTMNGAQSPEKTDFRAFAGRKVYIAPDHDQPGGTYCDKLLHLLSDAGATVVGILRNKVFAKEDGTVEDGYDLADAERDGWTADRLAALGNTLWIPVTGAEPPPPQGGSTPSKSSTLTKEGETAKPPAKEKIFEKTRRFAASNFKDGIVFSSNVFRAYRDGYWPELDQKVDVEKPILDFLGNDANPSSISAMVSLLSTDKAAPSIRFERNTPLICLENGTLDPMTGRLIPHDAGYSLTNKLSIAWDATAVAPLWLKTLGEIFKPDEDRADKIQALQEFMGYALVPMTHMHKFLWMVGAGGNGKSVILEVLTALVGRHNISFAQIERLQEKFVRAELSGKLLNISSEMSAQGTVADGYLKQIVSGDVIEAERKQQPSFSFKPYCRMIAATNDLPRLLDGSDGFFRRAMIIRFNRQFKETEQDKNLVDKLVKELPGILTWAIAGLQRLLQRGHFVLPASSLVEANKYRINSDPIRQFAEECLTVSDQRMQFITPLKLHEYYQAWCKAYGYQALAVAKLSERLRGLNFEQYRSGGARLWKVRYVAPLDQYYDDIPAEPPSKSKLTEKYNF
jgi:putative DNA primase/helicase